jgi:hypothetical protein
MMITSLLPLVIIIVLIIMLYVFQGYAQHRELKWVFTAYLFLLLSSTVVYYLLPDIESNNSVVSKNEALNIDQEDKRIQEFYTAAESGNLDQFEDAIVKDQWSFDYSGSQLEIVDNLNAMLQVVERKETDDEKIEVTFYTTKNILGGIDVTNNINPISVTYKQNRLNILPPEQYEINIASFKKDFVVSQFNGENTPFHSTSYSGGHQVIYIKIPNKVEVINSPYVQYVGEDI